MDDETTSTPRTASTTGSDAITTGLTPAPSGATSVANPRRVTL